MITIYCCVIDWNKLLYYCNTQRDGCYQRCVNIEISSKSSNLVLIAKFPNTIFISMIIRYSLFITIINNTVDAFISFESPSSPLHSEEMHLSFCFLRLVLYAQHSNLNVQNGLPSMLSCHLLYSQPSHNYCVTDKLMHHFPTLSLSKATVSSILRLDIPLGL